MPYFAGYVYIKSHFSRLPRGTDSHEQGDFTKILQIFDNRRIAGNSSESHNKTEMV